ncbi:SigE family RNA polymerase sigma factor [Lapillicoccus sp.]|uniref:RNA polymerase sigma factor n=1 Tax=Lapillicoccus sp. TaxID=1909287 RepID=UPI0025F0A45E|nr:SigE family RNA polymerase sigma factor [Lapillicoccus sp.]
MPDRSESVRHPDARIDVETLYAAHRLALVRLAVLLVDDVAIAEDVVQDAFIALHRGQSRIKDPGAALGYLRVSVVNGARSTLRRRRTVRSFLSRAIAPPDAAPADRDLMRRETGSAVFRAVQALPDRQREVLVLRYWSDLSQRQIAEALGISEGTVKSTASRALDKLEKILEEYR